MDMSTNVHGAIVWEVEGNLGVFTGMEELNVVDACRGTQHSTWRSDPYDSMHRS